MCPESSFDELLKTVEMNHQLSCDVEAGGCGKPNYMNHILSHPPHVFTAGNIWSLLNSMFTNPVHLCPGIWLEIGQIYYCINRYLF